MNDPTWPSDSFQLLTIWQILRQDPHGNHPTPLSLCLKLSLKNHLTRDHASLSTLTSLQLSPTPSSLAKKWSLIKMSRQSPDNLTPSLPSEKPSRRTNTSGHHKATIRQPHRLYYMHDKLCLKNHLVQPHTTDNMTTARLPYNILFYALSYCPKTISYVYTAKKWTIQQKNEQLVANDVDKNRIKQSFAAHIVQYCVHMTILQRSKQIFKFLSPIQSRDIYPRRFHCFIFVIS